MVKTITATSLLGLILTTNGVNAKKPYQQEKAIIASDGVVLGHFGHAIAVDGFRLFISSKTIGNLHNKVYINEFKAAPVPIVTDSNSTGVVSSTTTAVQSPVLNWYETEWIRSVPPTAGFGNALAASNNQLFIGSPEDSLNKIESSGSVAIYQLYDTSSLYKPIKPPTPTKLIQVLHGNVVNANFGCSVSVQGDGLVIGAKGVQAGAGRAMVYQKTGSSSTSTNDL